jgi:N6-L-threonylcarbamoyladenine synthase
MNILAIESSCDETAAAVVADGVTVLSSVIASSAALHAKYGGIVPEVAAREQLKVIIPTITEATNKTDYDVIAVTVGPGLIGSLLVGVETAKTMAMVTGKPLIPVNHVLAHMFANFIGDAPIKFPAISLVVSGGHTELFLMTSPKDLKWLGGTLDDAAGEAFDKTARLLGFENRGGPAIQESAARFQTDKSKLKTKLPRPLLHDGSLNFSFSGLKTAIWREWNKISDIDQDLTSTFAYEVQEAITDVLVAKTKHAAQKFNAKSVLISGGVAANLRLREKMQDAADKNSFKLCIPPISLCTDNAVYIASYAYFRGVPADWHTITAMPDLSVEE